VATVLGVIMMFGRTCLATFTGRFRRNVRARARVRSAAGRPHVRIAAASSRPSAKEPERVDVAGGAKTGNR
jgi:hypothetical protein